MQDSSHFTHFNQTFSWWASSFHGLSQIPNISTVYPHTKFLNIGLQKTHVMAFLTTRIYSRIGILWIYRYDVCWTWMMIELDFLFAIVHIGVNLVIGLRLINFLVNFGDRLLFLATSVTEWATFFIAGWIFGITLIRTILYNISSICFYIVL